MSAQCSGFIATSLDGYIARSDGSIDWLIEDLTITVIPILLGSGTPLFGALSSDVRHSHEFGCKNPDNIRVSSVR